MACCNNSFIATILGTIIAIMKLSKIKVLDVITTMYIEILRGTQFFCSFISFGFYFQNGAI